MRRVLLGVGAMFVGIVVVIGACSQRSSDETSPEAVETVTVATEEEAPDETSAEEIEPTADAGADEKAEAEAAWGRKIADWGDYIATSFGAIGDMTQDPGTAALLLLGDQETTILMAAHLAVLMQCGKTLKQEVGPPPTKRLQKSYRLIRRACGKYNLAAHRIAQGLDSGDQALLEQAIVAMNAGRRLVERSTAAIPSG